MTKGMNTEHFVNRLTQAKNFEQFESELQDHAYNQSFGSLLQSKIAGRGLTCAQAIRLAQIPKSYGYQIVNDQREPSRDKVLAFAIALSLDLIEANKLLTTAQHAPLYVKTPRDAAFMFALLNHLSVIETNLLLESKDFDLLE